MFMPPRLKLYALFALAFCTLPVMSACATPTETTPVIAKAVNSVQLNYKAGQVFSVVTVEGKEGETAKNAVSNYYKTAFPLSAKYGLKRDGQLLVKAVPQGTHKPFVAVFYSWPDAQSEAAFESNPAWPAIKATRPDAWNELRVYNEVLKDDLSLTFDSSKTYTMAVAWLNPDRPNDYATYMAGIQSAVTESGGRFLHEMQNPRFEAHARSKDAPGQVTFVEWDSPASLTNFQSTEGFKQNAKYLTSGVTDFELMILSVS